MKRTLTNGSITHITHAEVICTVEFFSECDSGTKWNLSPYNTVSANEIL